MKLTQLRYLTAVVQNDLNITTAARLGRMQLTRGGSDIEIVLNDGGEVSELR